MQVLELTGNDSSRQDPLTFRAHVTSYSQNSDVTLLAVEVWDTFKVFCNILWVRYRKRITIIPSRTQHYRFAANLNT